MLAQITDVNDAEQNGDRHGERKDERQSRSTEWQKYGQCRLGAICGGTERIESEGRHARG